tara:strand:+ start:170 stop:433 length:264 start_codon:yes stop_codon:yes gene_type:complete
MWIEFLSSVGLTVGLGVAYGGLYKLGWESARKEQTERINEMIRILNKDNENNKELIKQYEEHLENLSSHRINKWAEFRKIEEEEKRK